jgi:hypothetical protein
VPPPAARQACSADARVDGKLLLVPGKDHGDVEPPLPEMAGHDERVAAVVARAGEHQYGFAVAARDIPRQLGRCEPGALHEWRRRIRCSRGPLDRAYVGRGQNGRVMRTGDSHRR